jgi:hypothetical protein
MRFGLALPVAAWFVVAASAADDPVRPPLPDAVRDAVASRQTTDSDNLGVARINHREINPEGGVLVGFDVALRRAGSREVPHAFRPIYRNGEQESVGRPVGDLSNRKVFRTVRVTAKPGYAVGGMWVRSGPQIDRVCLRFIRVGDGGLDPTDHYTSDWIGTSDGGKEVYLDGRGRPIVGLLADATPDGARGIGLVYARVSPAPRKPPPGPNADTPAPPPGAELGPDGKTRLELEAEANRAQEQQPPAVSNWPDWLPFALVVGLAIPVALIALLVLGGNKGRRRPGNEERSVRSLDDDDGQPLTERPGLARRVESYLPATRAKKRRRAVDLPVEDAEPSERTPRPRKDTPRPRVAASQPIVALPTPTPEDLPPFFTVRATYRARHNRLTRIYVLENELLVIDAGPGADVNETAGLAAAAASGGGVIGALIGGAVGTMVADGQKARGDALQQTLDRLDLRGLLKWAAEDGNFRARYEELVGLSIDPPPAPSLWKGKSGAAGTFRFRHLERGEFTFDFLSPVEIRGAIEMMRHSAAANQVLVGDGWDRVTASYLVGV